MNESFEKGNDKTKQLADIMRQLVDIMDANETEDTLNEHDHAAFTKLSAEAGKAGLPVDSFLSVLLAAYHAQDNLKGVGKVAYTVRQIMAANVQASEWHEKQAITGVALFAATGSNQGTIRAYLKDNARMIDEHHLNVGIHDAQNHNRRVGQYNKRARK